MVYMRFREALFGANFQNVRDTELSLLVAHKLQCEHQAFLRKHLQPLREVTFHKQTRFSIKVLNYVKTVIHKGQKTGYSISKNMV